MRINIIILFSFLFSSIQMHAQQNVPGFDPVCDCVVTGKSPTHVFHGLEEICNVIYTTNTDYVLELYPDSTFKIYIFHFNSLFQSQTRLAYCGGYDVINDTIRVRYISSSFQAKRDGFPGECPADFKFYRPSIFVLSQNAVTCIDCIISQLSEISSTEWKDLFMNLQSRDQKKTEFITIEKRLETTESYGFWTRLSVYSINEPR